MVLHEYPLCMVDHTGFRRFVSALQPLFKMVTRNTIRYALQYLYIIVMLYLHHLILMQLIFDFNFVGRTSLIITKKKERGQLNTWLPTDLESPSQLIYGHQTIKRRDTWLSQHTLLMIIGNLGVLFWGIFLMMNKEYKCYHSQLENDVF